MLAALHEGKIVLEVDLLAQIMEYRMTVNSFSARIIRRLIILLSLCGVVAATWWFWQHTGRTKQPTEPTIARPNYKPRKPIDASGVFAVTKSIPPWAPDATLEELGQTFSRAGFKLMDQADQYLQNAGLEADLRVRALMRKAELHNYLGEPEKASAVLEEVRTFAENDPQLAAEWLYTIIYMQSVTALRRGETENCVLCRGESSCILPLTPAARHTNQTGSRLAIKYFREYLELFPDDLEVRWLLNVAHMTLGEHPDQVDPRFLISLDRFNRNEHGIGKFREIGHLVGINRLNMAGGAIMEDFHNEGRLDLVFTSMDPHQPMVLYRNKGDGTFEDRTKEAGIINQLGGLGCFAGDYNNDGFMDIYIPRGAWLTNPMRPTLLRNNGNGTFTDVTKESGLMDPMNSDTAQWVDFDNDGLLDLWVCNETGPSRLYRNKGDGTFEDVAAKAGLGNLPGMWKGCTWFDYDNDGYPDLFLNSMTHPPKLFHNNRNGTFTERHGRDGYRWPGIWPLLLVLGLRQRRMARHFRHVLRPVSGGCRKRVDWRTTPTPHQQAV